jgi:hypothetical protein
MLQADTRTLADFLALVRRNRMNPHAAGIAKKPQTAPASTPICWLDERAPLGRLFARPAPLAVRVIEDAVIAVDGVEPTPPTVDKEPVNGFGMLFTVVPV